MEKEQGGSIGHYSGKQVRKIGIDERCGSDMVVPSGQNGQVRVELAETYDIIFPFEL